MDTQTRYLWAFVGGFTVLSLLFVWSIIYARVHTFPVGNAPVIELSKEPPRLPPVRTQDPRLGSTRTDAIEIIEYADYRCLHCRAMAADLLDLVSDGRSNIRLIWREAPTSNQTKEALLPFAAARCAHAQGKFATLHPKLFQLSTLTEQTLLDEARAIGLNIARFQSCLNDSATHEAIKRDQGQALSYNITAAPTFFIKGKPYIGSLTRTELETLLR